MAGNPEIFRKTKDTIKLKFNIQDSRKSKKFFGVYYEWGREAKGQYAKITTEKDVKKLAEGYEKYTGSDAKVQKTPGYTGTTQSKINQKKTILQISTVNLQDI